MARIQRQRAAHQQKEDEHRQRIEVDLVTEHAARRESRPGACDERDDEAKDRNGGLGPMSLSLFQGRRFTGNVTRLFDCSMFTLLNFWRDCQSE